MTASEPSLLTQDIENGILRVTMQRGARRNPLSTAMLSALQDCLDKAADDANVRAIVLAGQAPGFCGGHDLKEMTQHRSDNDGGKTFYEALFASCSTLMQSIVSHPRVIIAEVNGIATAAGCQLVAACDMAVAGESARFGVNGINSGLFCSTPMVALSRNIGRKRAMQLLTTGELIDAHEAMSAGIINRICRDEELSDVTTKLALSVARQSRAVLALGKKAFYQQIEQPIDEAYALTSNVIVDNMMMDDAKEGISAFLEKRTPEWSDG